MVESSPKGYYPSLYSQDILRRTMEPQGESVEWLRGGAAGVIYRRGESVAPSRADVSISQTVENKEVSTGMDVAFVITVNNSGPDSAAKLVLTSHFPKQLEPRSLPADCRQDNDVKRITCTLPDLEKDRQAVIRLAYRATAGGEFSHRADVASQQALDPDTRDNASFAAVSVSDGRPAPRPQGDNNGTDAGGGSSSGKSSDGGGGGLALLLLLLPWFFSRHYRLRPE